MAAEYRVRDHMYPVLDYDPQNYKRIIYDPGRVTRIILNRPRFRNAISHPLFGEMENAFDRAAADDNCHVIVLSGAGTCFSGGDDAMGLSPESAPVIEDARTPEELMRDYGSEREVWRAYNDQHCYYIHELWQEKIRLIPKPTIAMVHGYCIFMAFGVANAMDLIFASEDALFLPVGSEIVWQWNPRKWMECVYEHRFVTAREAYEMGWVSRIYPDYATLEKETLAYAYRVADNTTHQCRSTKETVLEYYDLLGFTAFSRNQPNYIQSVYRQEGVPEMERNRQRYEGRGMARAPRAFANLKATLETQGKPVPQAVLDALARAAARDDPGRWEAALAQDWRDERTKQAAIREREKYMAWAAEEKAKVDAERARRGLS